MKKAYILGVLLGFIVLNSTAAYAGVLSIKAPFEGQAPVAEKLKADADPKCKLAHPDGIENDSVIVNSNSTLKNVFVYVKEGVTGKFEAPKEVVHFNQTGCAYTPKVLGVMTGQQLEILNSDDTLHNVHALPTQSQGFNLGMPIKGMKLKKSFAKPEIMVKVKCEVHPWMGAYIGVVDHPFFGVTGEDGVAKINNLPAGEYTVEAWHEKYGTQTQKITVTDQDQEVSFTFKAV